MGGNQVVKLVVDSNRTLRIATERTGFKLVPLDKVFRPDDIKKLNDKIKVMTETEFDIYLQQEFSKMGYSLKSKDANY